MSAKTFRLEPRTSPQRSKTPKTAGAGPKANPKTREDPYEELLLVALGEVDAVRPTPARGHRRAVEADPVVEVLRLDVAHVMHDPVIADVDAYVPVDAPGRGMAVR